MIIQDETMPGGGRVRLTRARSKGGEINWDRGHLANFLQALGWSHPSQMKATTDKSPKAPGANCNPTDCLQARRERGQDAAAIPCLLLTSLSCAKRGRIGSPTAMVGPPPLTAEGRLRTRGSAYRAIIAARPQT